MAEGAGRGETDFSGNFADLHIGLGQLLACSCNSDLINELRMCKALFSQVPLQGTWADPQLPGD